MQWPQVVVGPATAKRADGKTVTVSGQGLLMGQMVGSDRQPCGWLVAIGHSIVTVPLEAVRPADGKGGRR
jgi:hypothetical protein